METTGEFFNYDFGRQFLCLVLSIPIGVMIGVAANTAWEQSRKAPRAQQMLSLLLRAISHNHSLLVQVERQIENSNCPTIGVDLVSFQSVSAAKYEVIDDFDLCREIDEAQFELAHIGKKLDLMRGVFFDPVAWQIIERNGKVTSFMAEYYPELQRVTVNGAAGNKKRLDELKKNIERAIKQIDTQII